MDEIQNETDQNGINPRDLKLKLLMKLLNHIIGIHRKKAHIIKLQQENASEDEM